MNIGVIGGGATGLLMSYYLGMHHNVTTYVRRQEQKEKILNNGIILYGANKQTSVKANFLSELNEKELIIICVKSTDLKSVVKIVQEKAAETPILFLQNGMGHVALFSSLKNPIYVGVIEHGVVRLNDFTFNHLGKGRIRVSSIDQLKDTQPLIDELSNDMFPIEFAPNWELLLKEKLIVNAVINPLTALFDVDNRYIILNTYIKKMANQLCVETSQVLGLNAQDSWQLVKQIAINTGDNTSSMKSDIQHKRRTEIDAILGYIIKMATIEVPLVNSMYQCIKALEERNKYDNGIT